MANWVHGIMSLGHPNAQGSHAARGSLLKTPHLGPAQQLMSECIPFAPIAVGRSRQDHMHISAELQRYEGNHVPAE